MSQPGFDEELIQAVSTASTTTWSGQTYRHTSRNRDPLSGEGARLNGGRWNPEGISTLYLASPEKAAIAELERLAHTQGVTSADLVQAGRLLHTIAIRGLSVLDLTDSAIADHVGLDVTDFTDDLWDACQAVGQAADFLEIPGLLAPSATGEGQVLAIFEHRVPPGHLELVESRLLAPSDLERRWG